MKKFWKRFLYLIVILLLLQVVNALAYRLALESSYFLSLFIGNVQFFIFTGFFVAYGTFLLIPDRWSIKMRWSTSIIVTLFVFISGEILFTHWADHPKKIPRSLFWAYTYFYDFYDSRLIQFDPNHITYDSGVYYRLRPGSSAIFKNREFATSVHVNSMGLRDDSNSLNSPAVICLGDSYTMGWGVGQEENFPELLQKKSGLQILNAGISSYGTARELKILDQLDTSALKFLVIQYCSNDEAENQSARKHSFQLPISSHASFDSLMVSYKWSRKYYPGKNFLSIGKLFIKHLVNKIYPVFSLPLERDLPFADEKSKATDFLEILANHKITRSNVRIIVTVLDTYKRLNNTFLQQIDTLLQQEPYRTLLSERLYTVKPNGLLRENDFFKLDMHINESGHQKMADMIWNEMQKQSSAR